MIRKNLLALAVKVKVEATAEATKMRVEKIADQKSPASDPAA